MFSYLRFYILRCELYCKDTKSWWVERRLQFLLLYESNSLHLKSMHDEFCRWSLQLECTLCAPEKGFISLTGSVKKLLMLDLKTCGNGLNVKKLYERFWPTRFLYFYKKLWLDFVYLVALQKHLVIKMILLRIHI